ncbi:type IV secretion system protein [Escherichia coli]|uniref:type IV secretion system protein n=1 Tax=Escherichia coli TaxID=562 RepID=UPI003FA60588
MATSDFFQTARDVILNTLDQSTTGQLDRISSIASSLGKFGISIFILWYAYTVVVGKQKSAVQDFLWNLFRFWMIMIFVTNAGGWLDSSTQAIDGLKESFSGGDPWLWLDQLWTKVQQVAAFLMSKDPSTYVKTDGAIASIFTYAGGIVALLLCTIVYFSAEVTLKVLTVTAPLFIICLSFGFLRQMFNSWLQLIFSSLLIFLFGALALKAGTTFLNGILSVSVQDAEPLNLIATGATAFVAGAFMAWIIWQAKTYASQLAGVGVEGALQGAAAMGLGAATFGASRMGGKILGMGKNAGAGAWKGLRREKEGLAESTGVSGKVSNLTGQGINIGAKKLRNAAIEMAKKKYGG